MKELFGLPAHMFLVHAPVVLIPAVCAAVVAMVFWPALRRRGGLIVTGSTAVILVLTIMAVLSGQALDDALPGEFPAKQHERLGLATLYFVIALTVAVLAYFFLSRNAAKSASGRTPPLQHGLGAICAVLAVLSTVWLARTGHEGAKAAWGSTPPKPRPATTTTSAP